MSTLLPQGTGIETDENCPLTIHFIGQRLPKPTNGH